MSPERYRAREGLNWDDWAKRLGVSTSHLHNISTGRDGGSAELLFRIEDDTDGAVTARELREIRKTWLADHPPARPNAPEAA